MMPNPGQNLAVLSSIGPSPRKVEEKKLVASSSDLKTQEPSTPRLLPVLCWPSRDHGRPRTSETSTPAVDAHTRRLPSRVPHNATDELFIHLVLACFLVFWLTSAINRIVKEHRHD